MIDGVVRRGFPTPSGRLEFWSSTLAAWGWPEHALPGYIQSHVHPSELAGDQMVLLSTFRLPTQIHTRSANSKWLDELSHTNPVWIHPSDAARLRIAKYRRPDPGRDRDRLLRGQGVDHGGHPARRRRVLPPHGPLEAHRPQPGQRGRHDGHGRPATTARRAGPCAPPSRGRPYRSADPDTARIWWSDTGVHQNLTFPVHPDPISGMHCWHQAVRVRPAEPGDAHGDIAVDTDQGARGLPDVDGADPARRAASRPTAPGGRAG